MTALTKWTNTEWRILLLAGGAVIITLMLHVGRSVRAGMDFLINMGDTWLSSTPRCGAIALRTTMLARKRIELAIPDDSAMDTGEPATACGRIKIRKRSSAVFTVIMPRFTKRVSSR